MEIKVDSINFEEEVLKSDVPVLVDFWAEWCGPCKMMNPVLASIASDYEGKIKVAKIDADENGELAAQYGVQSIPNMKFFKNGEVVDEQLGMTQKNVLEEKLNKLL